MSLELFINSGSINEIDLSRIDGARFEDVFSINMNSCVSFYYNTQDFSIPPVTPPGTLNIPETNTFMFDENVAADWDNVTPTKIRLSLKSIGRLIERTNYQERMFEIIKNRKVGSQITITKYSTTSESDPTSFKTFEIVEANYFERVYDESGQRFYALEWGSINLTETADFGGLFDYLSSSEDRKDGFFTLTVTQVDTGVNSLEPPSQGDELSICITPSTKFGFLDVADAHFDSIQLDTIDIVSASMDSLLVTGSIDVTGSLLINGDDLKVVVGRTKFGSLLINYDTNTSTDPGNNYFKYNAGLSEEITELALSMIIHRKDEFASEASLYERVWTEIETKKYYGSLITLKNLNSNEYKVFKINSIERINYPNGFIKFGVTEIESFIQSLGGRLPAIDDEYSVEFDIRLESKTVERTTFITSGTYVVPLWAKKITVIAIGGGGGGGGGVGIIKNGIYPYGDSIDITQYLKVDPPPGYGQINVFGTNPLSYVNDGPNDVQYNEIIGAGGGAGGNVVWKTYTTDELEIGKYCSVFVGKGGKGFRGGYGKIIERYMDSGNLAWEGFGTSNYLDLPIFKNENTVQRKAKMFAYYDADDDTTIPGKGMGCTLLTRGGYESFNSIFESFYSKKEHAVRLKNSGEDSIFSFDKNGIIHSVIAEGGFGGSSGYAIPSEPILSTNQEKIPNAPPKIFPGYITPKRLIEDNILRYYITYSDPGPTHKQNKISGDYDEILLGGPGGHGISIAYRGATIGFNNAPNLPWNPNNQYLFLPWGTTYTIDNSYLSKNLGYNTPSDFAPTGGGGGNGSNKYLEDARAEFIAEYGRDIDTLERLEDPFGYYAFGFMPDTRKGFGGTNSIKNFIFDDIELGKGGDGGNTFILPSKNISPTLPTPGGLYGGGGGGGASLYFDIGTPDDEVKGQDGADGGDGIIVVIAEN